MEICFKITGAEQEDNTALLKQILQNQNTIMASLQELSAKVDELQTALDTEQEQIATALATLQQTVDQLQAQLADGGTPEERQAVLDKLNTVITDLKGTIPDQA